MKNYILWISLVGSLLCSGLLLTLFLHFPAQPQLFGRLVYSEPDSAPSSLPAALPRPALFLPQDPATTQKPHSDKPLFYLILDDVGSDKSQLGVFLELDFPISFAIMPHTRTSVVGYEQILARGQEPILHMPMEPMNGSFAGQGQINVGDTREEIEKKLTSALRDFPKIRGFNNHMGSAVTSSRPEMSVILDFAQTHKLFFVDSFTTDKSVVLSLAQEKGILVPRRNVFLDNVSTEAAIEHRLDEALDWAQKHQSVVLIGHIWSPELARVLVRREEELKNQVDFRFISTYFRDNL